MFGMTFHSPVDAFDRQKVGSKPSKPVGDVAPTYPVPVDALEIGLGTE